jgi:hypothetical protein
VEVKGWLVIKVENWRKGFGIRVAAMLEISIEKNIHCLLQTQSPNESAYCEHKESDKLIIAFSGNRLRIIAELPPPLT